MRVLLVDDDHDLIDWQRYVFQRDGHQVYAAFDGTSAVRLFELEQPDMVILDLNLPQRNGIEVLKDLRSHSTVPILILTAIGDEDRLVEALGLGADDYIEKPFRPRELRARVDALLRRSRLVAAVLASSKKTISLGEIELDPQRRQVTVAGTLIHLTRQEFALLHYLMLNRDMVIPFSDIIANVWGYDTDGDENMVRVTMSRLRRKVERDYSQPRYLQNSAGVGYVFRYQA